MSTENKFLPQARKTLERILSAVPGVTRLEWDLDQHSDQKELSSLADLTVGVNTNNRMDTLVVELKDQGHPRQLREAVNQLLRYRHRSRRNDYAVVAAPYITTDGAAVCRKKMSAISTSQETAASLSAPITSNGPGIRIRPAKTKSQLRLVSTRRRASACCVCCSRTGTERGKLFHSARKPA
jgi:hypothetical protein